MRKQSGKEPRKSGRGQDVKHKAQRLVEVLISLAKEQCDLEDCALVPVRATWLGMTELQVTGRRETERRRIVEGTTLLDLLALVEKSREQGETVQKNQIQIIIDSFKELNLFIDQRPKNEKGETITNTPYWKFTLKLNSQDIEDNQRWIEQKWTNQFAKPIPLSDKDQISPDQNKDVFFSEICLTYIYPNFPRDIFGEKIDNVINSDNQEHRQIDILQTFAPNLNDYFEHLLRCLGNNVQIRILLAWPYSEAAKLREDVLRRYTDNSIGNEINIRDYVIANLETLERIIHVSGSSTLLDVKLYDTLPSLAIYRAGDYMLAAPFLHGALAVNTFQLELKLNASNKLIAHTLQEDFELMWQVARRFYPDPNINWRNNLKILFTN